MKPKITTSKYLAVEAGGQIFGLDIQAIVRLVTAEPRESGPTLLESGILLSDDAVTVVDVNVWLGGGCHKNREREYLIQLRPPHADAALRVSRVLEVFELTSQEIQAAPGKENEFGRGALLGYGPMRKLSATLVRGALSANSLAFSTLASHGPIRLEQDKLYAGDLRLNGDEGIVDLVKRETGYGCTIFQDNVRVATTARRAGSQVRAVGSRANAEISALVPGSAREFRGVTKTIGKE